jgi:hypothetical protein
MSDPLLRAMDHYVVLEPGGEDAILNASDTRAWLARHLSALPDPPADLAHLSGLDEQVERLLETACALELEPGVAIQWFAVRLERPDAP